MKGILKKTTAAVLSLTMLGGVGTVLPEGVSLAAPVLTAQAVNAFQTISYDASTKTLYLLPGEISLDEVQSLAKGDNAKGVHHIVALEGSVLPEYSWTLFANYQFVQTVDLSKADASNVVRCSYMFQNCLELTSVDLSNFETTSLNNMEGMFYSCEKLEYLDLSSFHTSQVQFMNHMFIHCKKLKAIIVSSEWSTAGVTSDSEMFTDCVSLKSWKGTVYDSSITNSSYARIDSDHALLRGYLSGDCNYVKGASLTLDGKIGVNFHTRLSKDAAKVVLDGPEGKKVITEFAKLKPSGGLYKFSYGVNALQAGEPVTISIYNADGEKLDIYNTEFDMTADQTLSYSVNDYIADYAQYADDAKLSKLVSALDNYCKAAENYFISGTAHQLTDVSPHDLLSTLYGTTAGYDRFELAGCKMALVLNSGTAVRIFSDSGETTATLTHILHDLTTKQKELTLKGNASNPYFEISDIPAQQLTDTYLLTIGDEELVFMPMNYGYLAMTQTTDDALQTLCCALFDYTMAANDYFY